MAVTRKIWQMDEHGNITEADIGALAENVKESTQRRFVSDTEKEKWNGQVAANGGDISETNITLEEQAAGTKYPAMPDDAKKSKTTGGIFKRWLESLKTDKVDVSGGDISNTKMASVTASTASYPVPAAGDTGKVFMGKIIKFFTDIRNAATGACFIGQIVNNCTSSDTNKPLSAAQGKYLMDLYTGLNTNKLSKNGSETANVKIRFATNQGINGNAEAGAPITIVANCAYEPSARALIGFNNGGINAGVLWLNTDGRLRFTDGNNVTHDIAWMDDIN